MFEFQSVRRSFPRNLAENSEAASFLGQTTSFETVPGIVKAIWKGQRI
jgi:hypothetical protein